MTFSPCSRRRFLEAVASVGVAARVGGIVPAFAGQEAASGMIRGLEKHAQTINLSVRTASLLIDGKTADSPITIDGAIPGPLVRLREGQDIVINVTNRLKEDTSIHWHGVILPYQMDGVPGVSYPGIRPGQTFQYRFPVRQSGTYWYHSHTALQEQLGHFGPIIIDPVDPDPFAYDREFVVMLSDWMFANPYTILKKLKKMSGYDNFQRLTLADFFDDAKGKGWATAAGERAAWARMRMDPTDLADITGHTYTYLLNGVAPSGNWTGLFRPGEKIRLRFINAATMSYFDVRIPGLKMTVVAADGQNIEPVGVDEFRIAVAETYDVIVEPEGDTAYTIFAESMDRSGYARGTLAPRAGMEAPIPARRKRAVRSMADMGMDMGAMKGMDMGATKGMDMGGAGASEMNMGGGNMKAMDHAAMGHGPMAGGPWLVPVKHGPDHHGPGAAMVAEMSRSRLSEPGTGLGNDGRRVLLYSDLRALRPGFDRREPARDVELHLTGNMERYMWSFDGKKFSEVDGPIRFRRNERLRLTLVNDTMMDHPIHLHGMWMELDNGYGPNKPLKHTINVKPGERVSAHVTPEVAGDWAFHCHLLYHMDMGMFRVVSVIDSGDEAV